MEMLFYPVFGRQLVLYKGKHKWGNVPILVIKIMANGKISWGQGLTPKINFMFMLLLY